MGGFRAAQQGLCWGPGLRRTRRIFLSPKTQCSGSLAVLSQTGPPLRPTGMQWIEYIHTSAVLPWSLNGSCRNHPCTGVPTSTVHCLTRLYTGHRAVVIIENSFRTVTSRKLICTYIFGDICRYAVQGPRPEHGFSLRRADGERHPVAVGIQLSQASPGLSIRFRLPGRAYPNLQNDMPNPVI